DVAQTRAGVAVLRDPSLNELALAHRFADHVLERAIGDRRDGGRQRAARHAVGLSGGLQEDAEAHLIKKLCPGSTIEHLEARRHIGLEWKLMQQPRTE